MILASHGVGPVQNVHNLEGPNEHSAHLLHPIDGIYIAQITVYLATWSLFRKEIIFILVINNYECIIMLPFRLQM